MGLNLFGHSDRICDPQPPMPDKTRFSVLKRMSVGTMEIVEVYYNGCTTFNGRKLLLLRRHFYIDGNQVLDPHLLGNNHIVMARFEPTSEGWKLAQLCAKYLTER